TLLGRLSGLFVSALGTLSFAFRLGVGLRVLLFQLFEGRLLDFSLLAGLLFALLLFGFLFCGFTLRLTGAALLGERHPQPEQQLESLEVSFSGSRDRHV